MFMTKYISQVFLLLFLSISSQTKAFPNSSAKPMSKDIAANKMEEGTTVGFIGCGTIAVAIATGLLKQSEVPISCVYVSKRSESRSAALLSNFPDNVIVSDENQEIVDACSVLFLCVLPQQEEEVLNELEMKDDTILVSLVVSHTIMSTIKLQFPSQLLFSLY